MSNTFLDKLNVNIQPKALLSRYTTFQLGGPCKGLITCQTPSQLENVVKYFISEQVDFLLIGGGSNLVVSDKGVDCFVIRYVSDSPIIERDGVDLIVSGSTNLDQLALYAAEHGLEGINYCSGIPGTVGGAVVGNAGAFGMQIGDVIKEVTLITKNGKKKNVSQRDLQFTYRDSILKKTSDIVVSVRISLKPGNKDQLLIERNEILKIRHEKHPDLKNQPCAGSFFRNVEPTSKAGKRQAAGWFLEEAGGKDLKVGGAVIFEKHANIIVKSAGCRAQDVFELHKQMAEIVKDKFNINLIREVRFVGDFDGKSKVIKDVIW